MGNGVQKPEADHGTDGATLAEQRGRTSDLERLAAHRKDRGGVVHRERADREQVGAPEGELRRAARHQQLPGPRIARVHHAPETITGPTTQSESRSVLPEHRRAAVHDDQQRQHRRTEQERADANVLVHPSVTRRPSAAERYAASSSVATCSISDQAGVALAPIDRIGELAQDPAHPCRHTRVCRAARRSRPSSARRRAGPVAARRPPTPPSPRRR